MQSCCFAQLRDTNPLQQTPTTPPPGPVCSNDLNHSTSEMHMNAPVCPTTDEWKREGGRPETDQRSTIPDVERDAGGRADRRDCGTTTPVSTVARWGVDHSNTQPTADVHGKSFWTGTERGMLSRANGVIDQHPDPVTYSMKLPSCTTLPLSLRLRMCAIRGTHPRCCPEHPAVFYTREPVHSTDHCPDMKWIPDADTHLRPCFQSGRDHAGSNPCGTVRIHPRPRRRTTRRTPMHRSRRPRSGALGCRPGGSGRGGGSTGSGGIAQ